MSRYPRASAASRGYDYAWTKFRKAYLVEHPICVLCRDSVPSRLVAASVVDHVKPMSKGGDKYSHDNLRALCKPCHDGAVQSENRTGKMRGCDPDGNPLGHDW
jgi:5-methylcytosine-specific restriction enzyme A